MLRAVFFFNFLREFLFVVKETIIYPWEDVEEMAIIPRKEDLAKSGYKSQIYYKSLIILLYFWLFLQ
jgi:hypothetical protein